MKKLLLLLIFFSQISRAQMKPLPGAAIKFTNNTGSGSIKLVAQIQTVVNGVTFQNGTFPFTVSGSTALMTSAGVYDSNDNLIRTLWSGIKYDPGTHSVQWDGLFDDGTQAPFGSYNVKVLTNNVQYDWLGVIGNSSDSHISNQHLAGNGFMDMAIAGNTCYTAMGYAERDVATKKFYLNDIQKAYEVNPKQTTMSTYFVCTDGTNVYWAGINNSWNIQNSLHTQDRSFVFATKVSDDTEYQFANGAPETIDLTKDVYSSAILAQNDGTHGVPLTPYGTDAILSTKDIGGLAVQKNGSYLFVSYPQSNLLAVVNKSTGAAVQSLTVNGIGRIKTDNSDNLLIQVSGSVVSYIVNADGTVTATGKTVSAGSNIDFSVSPVTGNFIIADDANSQLKTYNAAAALVGTFGQAGGYVSNGPAVSYDKFMFHNKRGDNSPISSNPRLCFQADGSYWLFDPGNYRLLHYSSANVYQEKISYVPFCRSVNIDPNNPASMFADALEYQVDFSKVTTDINHSWELKYNWFSTTDLDTYGQFDQAVTLSNNHQYGIGGGKLYDLLPTGAILFTGINLNNQVLEQDGSLWARDWDDSGLTVIRKANLTGFTSNADGSQTPVWGAYVTVVTTPAFATNPNQPAFYINNTFGASTNPSRYFFFDQFYGAVFNGVTTGKGYHLGSIKTGDNKWEWLASKSLPESYGGEFSRNGWFDYSGQSNQCRADINGANIFWHVNCELGRFTETTYTNHFNEDGLFIGQFGTDNVRVSYTGDTRYWAGNSFKTQLAKVGSDLYYVYCDESKHAGIHLIKVSNLASIKEQGVALKVSAAVTVTTDPANLLSTLPAHEGNFTGNTIWSIVSQPTYLSTGNYAYEKGDNSISAGTSTYGKVRCLLSAVTQNSYTLSGQLSYDNSQPTFHDGSANYLDFTDQAGKVIARFEEHAADAYARSLRVNGVTITGSDGGNSYGELKLFTGFSYTYASGIFTFQIGKYAPVVVSSPLEAGADMTRPGYLVINQQGDYGNQYHQINLKQLRITTSSTLAP